MNFGDVVKEMTGLGGPYTDLKAWTDTIKPGKFLGHSIDAGSEPIKGVRPEFQKLLDAAEPKVKNEFKKSGSAIPMGYGIRPIGGFRNEISPHGAGVAIDIDGDDNPYTRGRTTPGLGDAHVHTRYEGIDHLRLLIANGITSARNMSRPCEYLPEILRLRDQIAKGDRIGPRLLTAGPVLDGPGAGRSTSVVIHNPDEARLSGA